ncbi:MerR family transcriptional regulator [Clostridiaceae bacterium HSG29]|nr:MerR family transcriptional regulator [Clostridiaceae bacterium HSG29]
MTEKITVGELAKQANVTVRTLQYYDKIDLLKPSRISKGGRRLYSTNDITILHQIITFKSLGLTLDEIKKRIMPINSNEDINKMLVKQTYLIKDQISKANKILDSIEMITNEINEKNIVDWSKYSNMMKLIQDNNESFWVMNYLEDDILENITHVHEQYSEAELPSDWLVKCMKSARSLISLGFAPDSEEAQALALEMWTMVEKYSNGEPEMERKLYSFYKSSEHWPKQYSEMQKEINTFLEKSVEYYISKKI